MDELKELLVDIKREIIALRTEMALVNYDIEKIREQLDKMEDTTNNPPPAVLDTSNFQIERL